MKNYELLALRENETLVTERKIEGYQHKRISLEKTEFGSILCLEDCANRPGENDYKVMSYGLDKEQIRGLINKLIEQL